MAKTFWVVSKYDANDEEGPFNSVQEAQDACDELNTYSVFSRTED